ncbi:MAG: DNA recombination/repair protein RecA, partial [Clostridiales bacterium]|nr:DNA recombination/repair protein RecA [Clostridiales bacterium]
MDEKKSNALEAALAGIERQFGKGSIMRLGEASGRMQVETV